MPHTPPPATAALGLATLLTLLVTAFAWPASELAPRDVPIVVAGPEPAVAQVEERLTAGDPGAFEVAGVADRAAAVHAIADRAAYGALVPGPGGVEVLTAPAASPAVAQLLTGLAASLPDATVTEVAPLPGGDPRGAVFAAGALPVVLGGLVTAASAFLVVRRPGAALGTVAAVALIAGAATTAVLQGWLDALGGSWWANAGVVALAISAVALPVLGLARLLGPAGLGLGALTILLLGNPLSGATSAPELLPAGWAGLGQLLPPGAATQALRSTAFFDGSGATTPLLVLGAWAAAGLVLAALPGRRTAVTARPSAARETAAVTA